MENKMITLNEYAARLGKAPRSVRQKCQAGTLPGAVKIGRDWLIPADAPYADMRVKTGNYRGWRKPKE